MQDSRLTSIVISAGRKLATTIMGISCFRSCGRATCQYAKVDLHVQDVHVTGTISKFLRLTLGVTIDRLMPLWSKNQAGNKTWP
ncbi:hypothetical protein HZ326_26213 [Fusarium oxysporum f. sp. albedinis]|nr:hypothetical protein HZ326_26213 [Fusarium oxysporum f. sp. albedinis]